MFTEELKNSIQYYRADDPPNSLSKKFWDEMQPALRCCGAEGWKDWERAGHLKRGHKVPASCCDSELGTSFGSLVWFKLHLNIIYFESSSRLKSSAYFTNSRFLANW